MNYYTHTLVPLIPCNPGEPGGPVEPLKCTWPEEIHKHRMHVVYYVVIDH